MLGFRGELPQPLFRETPVFGNPDLLTHGVSELCPLDSSGAGKLGDVRVDFGDHILLRSQGKQGGGIHEIFVSAGGEFQKNEIAPRGNQNGAAKRVQPLGPGDDSLLPLPLAEHDIDLIGDAPNTNHAGERVIGVALADLDGRAVPLQVLPCRRLEHPIVRGEEVGVLREPRMSSKRDGRRSDQRELNACTLEDLPYAHGVHGRSSSMQREYRLPARPARLSSRAAVS